MLRPLIPAKGSRGLLVRCLQEDLNRRGATISVDGSFGPATAKALEDFGPPALRDIPPVGLWIDRTWASDTTDYARRLQDVGAARVGLMLNSLDDGARFDPFAKPAVLRGAVDVFRQHDLRVDLTPWLYPSRRYVNALCDYVCPVLDDVPTVRLDNDCESAWGGRGEHKAAANDLFARVNPGRVSVNDYASLQDETKILLRWPGVTRRPQLYSVAFTNHAGGRKDTNPASVYWPGRTQEYGMDVDRWGGDFPGELDVGMAAYKPFSAAVAPGDVDPIRWQLETQIRAALWFRPRELWFWSARTTAGYLQALRDIIRGA